MATSTGGPCPPRVRSAPVSLSQGARVATPPAQFNRRPDSGQLVVGDVIAGIFRDIDLHQVAGLFQELPAFRGQMTQVQILSRPRVAFRQVVDGLDGRVIGHPGVRKVDDHLGWVSLRIEEAIEAVHRREKQGPMDIIDLGAALVLVCDGIDMPRLLPGEDQGRGDHPHHDGNGQVGEDRHDGHEDADEGVFPGYLLQ